MKTDSMKFRRRLIGVIFLAVLSVAGCSEDRSPAPQVSLASEAAEPSLIGPRAVVVYSASDQAQIGPVLEAYTAETGVKVNLVVDDYDQLAARIARSGSGSVADLLIVTNVGDLWHATEKDFYRPVYSTLVATQIPENLRDAEKVWYALSVRARIVVYNRNLVEEDRVATITDYGSLGDEWWHGKLCLSSSSVQGNRSLIAYLIKNHGARNAELIVRGWQANLATTIFSDDSELLQAVADEKCAIGMVNSNDLVGFIRARPGTPVTAYWFAERSPVYLDVTAAGVTRHAENPDSATALLEWLTSEQPNALFAALGLEFPANSDAPADASIAQWRGHVAEPGRLAELGYFQDDAVKLAERAHYP